MIMWLLICLFIYTAGWRTLVTNFIFQNVIVTLCYEWFIINKTGNVRINVILKCVNETIVAVDK